MKRACRTAALALALATVLAAPLPRAEEPPCKNHYILRPYCNPEDLALRWETSAAAPWPTTVGHTATLLADGRVLVVGGHRYSFDPVMDPDHRLYAGAQVFDPAAGTWAVTSPTLEHRYYHQAVRLLDGRVLVIGGDHELLWGDYLRSAEIFDPATGAWTRTGELGVSRGGFTASLLSDGKVLVAGGATPMGDTLGSAELYDPVSGTWSPTGDLGEPRYSHTATTLADGRVLVVAGMTHTLFELPLGSAEIFDPRSGGWAPAGAIPARAFHTASLTDSGEVLVAGGTRNAPSLEVGQYWWLEQASSAIFDPSRDEWRDAGAVIPRHHHLAVTLPGQRVLLVGGSAREGLTQSYPAVAAFEVFGGSGWRQVEFESPPVSPGRFWSATPLADDSVLLLGDVPGARAVRLRYRD
jgi:hypothetical protein